MNFHKHIKIFPGVTLNLSRTGISVSVGIRGLHFTIGPKGVATSASIPGTGLSYRKGRSK